VPAISSKISHVAGFRLATLASTQPHAVLNTNLQKRVYTTSHIYTSTFNKHLIASTSSSQTMKPDYLYIGAVR